VFVGMLVGASLVPPAAFPEYALRFWVGDAVGILVTIPLLLAAADAAQRASLVALARKPETLLQLGVLLAALWLVFGLLPGDPTRWFYLLFLPMIWIAVRGGLNGALLAVFAVQVGIVLSVHQPDAAPLAALELQALLAALTLSGFFLGIMVEERARAAAGLRESLRLAAAGEMAGAIAHEVNQPLTALANYGEAARMLLRDAQRPGGDPGALLPLLDKMRAETGRAAEIVRRLRDFFREGTMRLQPLEAADVVASARRIAQQLIGTRPVTLETSTAPGLPAVLADRVQIELILRNLVANALEAMPEGRGSLRVHAAPADAARVRFAVADSGGGIAAPMRAQLFSPFSTSKASGMGLGLAVSRAIAEAHGGTLELADAAHGEFHLILPAAQAHETAP